MFFPVLLVLCLLSLSAAYTGSSRGRVGQGLGLRSISKTSNQQLSMGFFDSLFGPKKSASARHILLKTKKDLPFLNQLKEQISSSKDPTSKFAELAAQHSTCPSSKNGGSLGTFKQGQMVPAFDKVVFSEDLGVVHGPVTTPFGYHLILIESRSD